MKRLLEQRNIAKKKKPDFKRTDSNKYKFNKKWAKPRGLHNKRRLKKKGHQKCVKDGYRSPCKVRGLNRDGKKEILIFNVNDLGSVVDGCVAKISSSVGMRTKVKIVNECVKNKIEIVNLKNAGKFLNDVKDKLAKKKKEGVARKEKKKKEKAKLLKKAEEKKDEKKEGDIKKEVLDSKVERKDVPKQDLKKQDTTRQKAGHMASSVPGAKQ